MSSKEIIKKNDNELIFSLEDQSVMDQMVEDSNDYSHAVDAEDLITPRLKLIQQLSPEILKGDAKFIEGAEIGDMVEALSSELFKADKGILFIPVKNIINYIEWQGKGKNAKLINNYGGDASFYLQQKNANKIDEKGKIIGTKSDSRVVKTYNFYGFIYNHTTKSITPLVIPMSGSKSKVAKKINSMISMRCDSTSGKSLPSFAGIYHITSTPESSEDGDYMNYACKPLLNQKGQPALTITIPEVGQRIYNQAKELYNSLAEYTPNLAFKEETPSDNRM